MSLTNTWSNNVPMESEVISLAASRIRQFKVDVRERINENIPIGAIMEWYTETAPDGFLECAGSSIAVSSYYGLFLVLGYRHGGSGANFNLPDMRGLLVRCWKHGKTGVDLDADSASSCTGNLSGTTVSSVTGLAGVPRLGAKVTGTGIPADTFISSITTFGSNGIPTQFEVTQSCTTGTGIAITIDNDVVGSIQYDENKTHDHTVTYILGASGNPGSRCMQTSSTGSSGTNESRPKNQAVMYIIRSDNV